MASNDASYLRLLPFVKGFENVADALGLALNHSSLRHGSKNFAAEAARPVRTDSTKNPSYLDTYSNIRSVFSICSAKRIVLADQIKRLVAGALLSEKAPEISPWSKKPYDPRKIAKRLLSCQASWMVLREKSTAEISLLPNFCNTAPCPACSRKKSASLLARAAEKLERSAGSLSLRWLTLTAKNPPFGSLDAFLKKMLHAFRELRQSHSLWSPWSAHVRGYIWSLEISHNPGRSEWHPHFHVLLDGSFFPQHLIDSAWNRAMSPIPSRAIIGECYVVIEGKKTSLSDTPPLRWKTDPKTLEEFQESTKAENILSVIAETVKYVLKPFETSSVQHREIRELMAALHNKRLKGTGGTLFIPRAPNLHLYENLGGLNAVLDPTSPKYIDDETLFSKIIDHAHTRPFLWFQLLRFWEPAYWIEKANHEPGAQNGAIS
jgi:hypothetical protein